MNVVIFGIMLELNLIFRRGLLVGLLQVASYFSGFVLVVSFARWCWFGYWIRLPWVVNFVLDWVWVALC